MKKKSSKSNIKKTMKKAEVPDGTCSLVKVISNRAVQLIEENELNRFDEDFSSLWLRENIYNFYKNVLYDPRYDVDFNRMNNDLLILYTVMGFVLRYQKAQETLISFQDEVSRFCSERAGDSFLFGSSNASSATEVENGN